MGHLYRSSHHLELYFSAIKYSEQISLRLWDIIDKVKETLCKFKPKHNSEYNQTVVVKRTSRSRVLEELGYFNCWSWKRHGRGRAWEN